MLFRTGGKILSDFFYCFSVFVDSLFIETGPTCLRNSLFSLHEVQNHPASYVEGQDLLGYAKGLGFHEKRLLKWKNYI